MDVNPRNNTLLKTKLILVFFSMLVLLSCAENKSLEYKLIYTEGRAVAIEFKNIKGSNELAIVRKDAEHPVLGAYTRNSQGLRFTPVVPFQSGTHYSIRYKEQQLAFKTKSSQRSAPEVLAIYPSADTVPENLLKIYVHFSEPMQHIGSAKDYIQLKKQGADDFLDVFLSLETELWNEDHTQLTLWLDPGRIKKELIPNKERGTPLEQGQHYELHIDPTFESAQGQVLKAKFVKEIYVGKRDTRQPQIEDWSLTLPSAHSKTELIIAFNESLDAILLKEVFEIIDSKGGEVAGNFHLGAHERSLLFNPLNNWNKGVYKLKVKAILEDLAANNLNRLFDKDLQNSRSNLKQAPYFYLDFEIE